MRRYKFGLSKQSSPNPKDPANRPIVMVPTPQFKAKKKIPRTHANTSMSHLPLPDVDVPQIPIDAMRIPRLTKSMPQSPIKNFYQNVARVEKTKSFHNKSSVDIEINGSEYKDGKKLAETYLANYALHTMTNEYAITIQNAFRKYNKMRKWKNFTRIRKKEKNISVKFVFIAWKLFCQTQLASLREIHSVFLKNAVQHPHFFDNRRLSRFDYFYVSGNLTNRTNIPSHKLKRMHFLLFLPSIQKVFDVWREQIRSQIRHRELVGNNKYTIGKLAKFGRIYTILVCWNRYIKWKKQHKASKSFVILKVKEINPHWNVYQRLKNHQIVCCERADKLHKRFIAHQILITFMNENVKSNFRNQTDERGKIFYFHSLMTRVHKSWLLYLEAKTRERAHVQELMHAWYGVAYKMSEDKNIFQSFRDKQVRFQLILIMRKWRRISHKNHLEQLRGQLMIQSSPSLPLSTIYLMMDKKDFYFSVQQFRKWLLFSRMRRRWQFFSNWVADLDSEYDFKYQVFMELFHIGHIKLFRRLYENVDGIIPRKLGFSFELMLKEIDSHEVILAKEAKSHWRFQTEMKKSKKIYSKNTLIRALTLRLHQLQRYAPYVEKQVEYTGNPSFERLRSLKELEDQVEENSALMKKRMITRDQRDNLILSSVMSHQSAISFSKELSFTVQDGLITAPIKFDTEKEQKLCVFPDFHESIKELEKDINNLIKIPKRNTCERNMTFAEFRLRLRNPAQIKINEIQITDRLSTTRHTARNKEISSPTKKIKKSKTKETIQCFNKTQFIFIIDWIQTASQMIDSICAFFKTVLDLKLEVEAPITIEQYRGMYQEQIPAISTAITRNIQLFLLESTGAEPQNRIQRHVNAPESARSAISTIITITFALQNTRYSQMVNKHPFLHQLRFDNFLCMLERERLWNGIEAVEPGIKIPTSKSRFAEVASKIGELPARDAYFACFILPYILEKDTIPDFIRSELLTRKDK